eukprot:4804134-Pyramimonas_sp.AAC.1
MVEITNSHPASSLFELSYKQVGLVSFEIEAAVNISHVLEEERAQAKRAREVSKLLKSKGKGQRQGQRQTQREWPEGRHTT